MVYVVDALPPAGSGSAPLGQNPYCPSAQTRASSPARPSIVVLGLMNSSRPKMTWPKLSLHRYHRAVKVACGLCSGGAFLRFQRERIHVCAVKARQHWRSNLHRYLVAQRRFAGGLGLHGPGTAVGPIGTRLMLSTPPATTKSSQPERTFCAAMFTASSPEAQKRLIRTPDARKSHPALSAATLGITEP